MWIIENTSSFTSFSHKSAQEGEVFLHIICLLGKMEDNQISDWEDSNIYRLQNICLFIWFFGNAFKPWEDIFLRRRADEFSEYIFPASRCYGGAHLDSGHRPPWFCLKIFKKTIFLEGHQHHNNEPHKMHNYCNVLFQNVNQNIKCWKLSDKRQVQISMWYFMFTRHKINFYCFSVIWSSK